MVLEPEGASEATSGGSTGSEPGLWLVTVTVAGPPVTGTAGDDRDSGSDSGADTGSDTDALAQALTGLMRERPFIVSARYAADRVEIRYWDEAETIDDAAALGLRLWFDHRDAAGLPDWPVVGLEVIDRATVHERADRGVAVAAREAGTVSRL